MIMNSSLCRHPRFHILGNYRPRTQRVPCLCGCYRSGPQCCRRDEDFDFFYCSYKRDHQLLGVQKHCTCVFLHEHTVLQTNKKPFFIIILKKEGDWKTNFTQLLFCEVNQFSHIITLCNNTLYFKRVARNSYRDQ